MKKVFSIFGLFLSILGLSQVGINTDAPKAVLHINASSNIAPKTTDGILIPKVKNFPIENPVMGMLVFLEGNDEKEDNFYFFDGESWVAFQKNEGIESDEDIYSFNGEGITNGYLNFSKIIKKDLDKFEIQNNRDIVVGRRGVYIVQLFSSVKRTAPNQQSNLLYYIDVKRGNEVQTHEGSIGYSAEQNAGSSMVMSFVEEFQEGDIISVRVEGTVPTNATYIYTPFGGNHLTLTYIHN